MVKVKFKRNVNISRLVKKIVVGVLSLYVGGEILQKVADTMVGTCSPFYDGLRLLGWTVSTGNSSLTNGCAGNPHTITDVSGNGLLGILGLVFMASIVLEFVNITW